MFFFIAGGGLDRMAPINAGVESDVPCEVGVTSDKGMSKYRIHFQHAISQPSDGEGRATLALSVTEEAAGSAFRDAVSQHLGRLRQLLARSRESR